MIMMAAAPFAVADPILDVKGEIDPAAIKKLIEEAAPAIRDYPPHFNGEAQKASIVQSMRDAVGDLTQSRVLSINSPELATNVAFVLAMGHNLDLGTSDLANKTYQMSLKLDPDSRRANFYYGMFLASTAKGHESSLLYLQKAFDLGEAGAEYTIGLLLVEQGRKEEGLNHLEHYSARFPDDQRVKKIIESVKNDLIEFHKSGG